MLPVTAEPPPETQPHKYRATSNSPTIETDPPITRALEGHSEHYGCLGRWECLLRGSAEPFAEVTQGSEAN